MYWIVRAVILLVILAAAGSLYVRLAPTDSDEWHVDPSTAAAPGAAGVLVRFPIEGDDILARFDAAMMAEPRVKRIAGAVEDGRITYEARSRWIGFPDYVTVTYADGALVVLSRLRFGNSDLGVNGARLERVLERL